MKRKIKFRGKRVSSGDWVYGFLCSPTRIFQINYSYAHNIDPATVGQFTGLLDKNGTEIYEGDILRLNGGAEDVFGTVLFEYGCFAFDAHWIKEGYIKPELYRYTEVNFVDCVVFGNIHEKSESK